MNDYRTRLTPIYKTKKCRHIETQAGMMSLFMFSFNTIILFKKETNTKQCLLPDSWPSQTWQLPDARTRGVQAARWWPSSQAVTGRRPGQERCCPHPRCAWRSHAHVRLSARSSSPVTPHSRSSTQPSTQGPCVVSLAGSVHSRCGSAESSRKKLKQNIATRIVHCFMMDSPSLT